MPKPAMPPHDLDPLAGYAGRWVARLGEAVVAQGGTPEQARSAARQQRFKEIPEVFYVPTANPLAFNALLHQIAAILPGGYPVYLVGGAVRDALLGRAAIDLDFITPAPASQLARQVADALGGAYYPLDEGRGYGRVILSGEWGQALKPAIKLDFTPLEGKSLEEDLAGRDFTINAMAVDVHNPQALLDPLGGASDLVAKRLRACSPTAISHDPLRILRAIRLAAEFGLKIQPETLSLLRQSAGQLSQVSPERLRDEILRILRGPQPGTAMRALEMLGALPGILPECLPLKGVSQTAPHIHDVWEHTLEVLKKLDEILDALGSDFDPSKAGNLTMGLVVLLLGRYREQISQHLAAELTPDRSLRGLLFLAALYHDTGKPGTRREDNQGRISFIAHEKLGAEIASELAQRLRLSNPETERLVSIIRHHLRPILLTQLPEEPSRRAVYRFFRDTGEAGVDICLLSLADVLGTYGTTLSQDAWASHLKIVRRLLEAWWERPAEMISPPGILNGNELMQRFDLKPGKVIGRLLEAIRESQAAGEVNTKEEAFALVDKLLAERGFDPTA